MILEIIEGPEKGRRIKLRENQTVTLGRTESATEQFAEDLSMSALHLAVGLSAGTLKLTNLSKTNGTLVNGARVESATLQPGDRIFAGSSVFAVIGPPPSLYSSKFRVGGWGFHAIPDGWKILEGVGFVREANQGFRANAAALEDALSAALEDALSEDKKLSEYMNVQMDLAKSYLPDVEMQGPVEARVEGSEEALLLTIRSTAKSGERIVQRQLYARSGEGVGVLTLSVLDSEAVDLNPVLAEIVRGATFHKPLV